MKNAEYIRNVCRIRVKNFCMPLLAFLNTLDEQVKLFVVDTPPAF